MPDRDITASLTGENLDWRRVSDASDACFSCTREKGDKRESIQRSAVSPVRNVRGSSPPPLSDDEFWSCLASWPAAREHPRWRDRPELQREIARLDARNRLFSSPKRNMRN